MSVFRLGQDVERAALEHVSLDERPRRVADRGDGLAGGDEVTDQAHRPFVHPQSVGVGDAAGEDERVEVVDAHVTDDLVDRARVALVEVVEHLDLAALRRDEHGLVPGVGDGGPRLGELDLLDALGGDEECDLLAGHQGASFGSGVLPR